LSLHKLVVAHEIAQQLDNVHKWKQLSEVRLGNGPTWCFVVMRPGCHPSLRGRGSYSAKPLNEHTCFHQAAMRKSMFDLAEECLAHAKDFSGQLLMYS
jgi:coatomer subunit beta'